MLPDAWGIHASWVDARDEVVTVAAETVERLRAAMGSPPDDLEDRAPIVARRGADLGLGPVEVACEDGARRTFDGRVPDNFPYGYHDIESGERPRRLIVSPGRCWLPEGWRAWAGRSSCTGLGPVPVRASVTSQTSRRSGSGPRASGRASCSSTRCTR